MQNDRSSRHSSHRAALLDAAMRRFWVYGFNASSMRDLIAATGSNRATLYAEFGDKDGLFLACLGAYRAAVVDPAFQPIEAPGAGLAKIRAYFEQQISLAETVGLPGPGCLIANSMTERAPHDPRVHEIVSTHFERLHTGFTAALRQDAAQHISNQEVDQLGAFVAVSCQGLWSHSRLVDSAAPLRGYVDSLLALIKRRLSP